VVTLFIVFAVVIVLLLWWIGSNVYAIAKRGEPAQDPNDRTLTVREHRILSKRPDYSDATEEEWLAWHEKYKGEIDTKFFSRIASISRLEFVNFFSFSYTATIIQLSSRR
jgi:hypothetical protein